MKHIHLVIILLLLSIFSINAQQNDNSAVSKATESSYRPSSTDISDTPMEVENISSDEIKNVFHQYSNYLSKYHTRRWLGWTALGVGSLTTFVGICFSIQEGEFNFAGPGSVILAGGLVTLSSIPLLISAYHFKHKARRLEMSLSAIEVPKYVDRASCVPSLRLALTF